jgi:hypothetical protein
LFFLFWLKLCLYQVQGAAWDELWTIFMLS